MSERGPSHRFYLSLDSKQQTDYHIPRPHKYLYFICAHYKQDNEGKLPTTSKLKKGSCIGSDVNYRRGFYIYNYIYFKPT